MKQQFATAINCMDGRVQRPVIDYLLETYQADFVDMITEPGPNKILSDNSNKAMVDSIRQRVEMSVLKHLSRIIAVVGHHDCAGNPASQKEQEQHLANAVDLVNKWGLPVKIISGLWVDRQFKVSRII